MDNYRDASVGATGTEAGFQFEFSCQHCSRTWRSPLRAYKRGRLAGWLDWVMFSVGGRGAHLARQGVTGLARVGFEGAREAALAEALGLAKPNYSECPGCRKWICRDCRDTASGLCPNCKSENSREAHLDGRRGAEAASPACPSCGQPSGGGRFCEGCGFDLASTHKSCPGCGAMVTRAARFCADCGHGF